MADPSLPLKGCLSENDKGKERFIGKYNSNSPNIFGKEGLTYNKERNLYGKGPRSKEGILSRPGGNPIKSDHQLG